MLVPVMAIVRGGSGRELFPVGKNCVSEGTLSGGAPTNTVSVETILGQSTPTVTTTNGNRGYIANDSTVASPSSFTIEIAHTGTNYTTAFTLAQGEVFDVTGWDIATVRLTLSAVADCAFRIHIW